MTKQWKIYEKECQASKQQNRFFKIHQQTNSYYSQKFGKNYAAIYEIKPVLTLNKPIYVEFTVLELSKWLMCDFHYNWIKKHFDAELLFTDTDSFTYDIKSEDVYEEFFKHKHLFDFSNYPKDSKFCELSHILNMWYTTPVSIPVKL